MVLVDERTGSAAEDFASVFQDNRAGIIVGARTAGAGCGYTNGGTPTTLTNTRAVLRLPDCVGFRADGSNETDGVIPDVLVGMRAQDGSKFRAKLVEAKLPEAVQLAEKLIATRASP
jgi:C-terminal processing protease CtpA/Prc